MSADYLAAYRALVAELYAARRRGPGGQLSQAEEAARTAALEDCWLGMTSEERDAVEADVEREKAASATEAKTGKCAACGLALDRRGPRDCGRCGAQAPELIAARKPCARHS